MLASLPPKGISRYYLAKTLPTNSPCTQPAQQREGLRHGAGRWRPASPERLHTSTLVTLTNSLSRATTDCRQRGGVRG